MLTNIQRIRLLAMASDSQLKIEQTDEGTLVSGFLPEWQAYADVSQNNTELITRVLKMSPVASNVTRAGFHMADGALWTDFEKGKLIFDNKGMSWYLFLSPGLSDEAIGSAAVDARAKVIQAIMNAENSNDQPFVRS